jgi:hypothetical protein
MTDIDMTKFNAISHSAQEFRVRMVLEHVRSEDDLVMLSSQLLFEAVTLWRALGGPEHAAAQLYAAADAEAATTLDRLATGR